MTDKQILIETIDALPEEKIAEVLSFVKRMIPAPVQAKPNKWAEFAGILTDQEAETMISVIEEHFERIENE